MKEVKDLFSKQSDTYATFRPVYPQALYDYLFSLVPQCLTAWDCGTGNGQVAAQLAKRFDKVHATDISVKQIQNAIKADNIQYIACRAEDTPLANDSIDLVTIGTALHWFDFEGFYAEVHRVAKQGSIIAAWCYAPFRASAQIDHILDDFYSSIVGKYWDPERRYVEEQYTTIPFPFDELPHPQLEINVSWTRDHFIGFLNSWSSVHNYMKQHDTNPVALLEERINAVWAEGETKKVVFPLYMRVGRVSK